MDEPLLQIIPEYDDQERAFLALERSWADFLRAARTGHRVRVEPAANAVHYRGGSFEQSAAQFEIFRERLAAGERAALIDALGWACRENVPLPYWAADGILDALEELDSKPTDLHQVFAMGARYPISTKRALKVRSDWKVMLRVYGKASLMIAEGMKKMEAVRIAIKGEPICFRNAIDRYNEMDQRQQKGLRAWYGKRLHKLR